MKHINELLEARLGQMEPQQETAMNRMRIRNLLAKVRAKRADRRRAAA
tara:strand:- start:51106 stop:51249 length:144 start_codon:yes stop_codon:yes gene_type:complete